MHRLLRNICPRPRVVKNRAFSSSVIEISDEVQNALHHGKPVVALESTIVTHGMPHPNNLETALSVEKIIRDNGVVPATIGILKGKVRVGKYKS
uniref:Pseudouridine-5'-phosphate glycosidase n=1 Tax=Magallana gigas TaxID=29159 RepID=A0A8W8MZI3_MAGGI